MSLALNVRENIFVPGELYASCHASTHLVLPSGVILAAWFGGSYEKCDDVDIWFSRRVGGQWEIQRRAAWHPGVPCWNPVLFDFGDRVRLFYKVGKTIPAWKTYYVDSFDEGVRWTEPAELVPGDVSGGRGPVKNKPIRLRDGAVLCPASKETEDKWDCFTDRSEDNGNTYLRSDFVKIDHEACMGKGIIQPTLWQDPSGTVHMLTRSTEGRIYFADSSDGGRTWTPAVPSLMPNNNSGIDLCRMENGLLVLACNPVMERETWGDRTPLSLFVSEDEGKNFKEVLQLENERVSDLGGRPEFSYPSVTARGGNVYVTYTWNRRTIRFCHLQWID